jgi:hypothetical protein
MARNARRSSEGTTSDDALSPRVSVALEEYRALRGEIIASLSMQQTVLSFSTLALGGLALAGLHELRQDGDPALALLIFLLLLPLVSYVTLFIWLGEYARTTRAGLFLSKLEQRINEWVGDDVLSWEQFLRTPVRGKPPQYAWNVLAMFVFYASVPVVAVSVVTAPWEYGWLWLVLVWAGEAALWLAVVGVFLRRQFRIALDDANGGGEGAETQSPSSGKRLLGLRVKPA